MQLISICSISFFFVLMFGFFLQVKTPMFEQGLNDTNRYTINKGLYFVVFAIFAVTSTMRHAFIDTFAYKDVYKLCRFDMNYVTSDRRDMERGWYYLNYYLNYISESPKMILGLVAIVIVGAYILLIKKYSTDPLFSLLLFFFLEYMDTNNGMRQMLAAGLAFFGYYFFLKRKWWGYALFVGLVVLAMQFHTSVEIVFILIIMVQGKPLNNLIKLSLALSVVFVALPTAFQGTFEAYFDDSEYFGYMMSTENGMSFMRCLVVAIVPLVFTFIYKRKVGMFDRDEAVMVNFTVLNSVFVLMGLVMQFWARLSFYTAFAPMIMMPKYINTIFSPKYRNIVKPIAILLYFGFFAYNIYVNNEYGAMKNFYWSWD